MDYCTTSTGSDDNKQEKDPRIDQWDKDSRDKLILRLNDAVEKRCDATEKLIPHVITDLLYVLGVKTENMQYKIYTIPPDVITKTHKSITTQITEWKGLRWWRFNKKNPSDLNWNSYFKKAKCWQDQNQHKPLGKFWSLLFDSLKQYTKSIAATKVQYQQREQQSLQKCLFSKCVEKILKGNVRFERTRETPLLPVRALTQSKELQEKLQQIDSGFAISSWKSSAENKHKLQKQNSRNGGTKTRANVATIINEQCGDYATKVYRLNVQSLHRLMPNLKIDWTQIRKDDNISYSHSNYNTNNNHMDIDGISPSNPAQQQQQQHHHHHRQQQQQQQQHNHSQSGGDRMNYSTPNTSQRINHRSSQSHPQIFATLPPQQIPINSNNSNNNYGPSRGGPDHLRSDRFRHSPTLSSSTDISSI
eukprot:209902_1